jgi:hypothetical protein
MFDKVIELLPASKAQVGSVFRLIPMREAQFGCVLGGETVAGKVTLIIPCAVKGLDILMVKVYDVFVQTIGFATLTVALRLALTAVKVVVPNMIGNPFLSIWNVRGPVVSVEAGA